MIVLAVVAAVAYLAAVLLALALGIALADRAAYKRTLTRVREQRDKYRAQRDEALNAVDLAPPAPGPVWTDGAPPEAIDAEFDEITRLGFIADGSDK